MRADEGVLDTARTLWLFPSCFSRREGGGGGWRLWEEDRPFAPARGRRRRRVCLGARGWRRLCAWLDSAQCNAGGGGVRYCARVRGLQGPEVRRPVPAVFGTGGAVACPAHGGLRGRCPRDLQPVLGDGGGVLPLPVTARRVDLVVW